MIHPFYPVLPALEWIERLVPCGVRLVQLRLKDAGRDAIMAQIAGALRVCAAHHCTLVVNDHWREAIALGAPAVHLGQEDLASADIRAIRAAGIKFGLSTHSHDELATALAARPDYVALGPIYPTTLKKMVWPAQGLERIGEWKRTVAPLPLVAIGGITLARAPGVIAAGADAVAVVTDIIAHPDPQRHVRDWLSALAPAAAP
jgi:thiamine-phosphate pyrophosphorylase